MKTTNLIPTPRREAKRRRKQRNACAAACGAYALLLAGALGVAHLVWSGGSESVEARLDAVQQDTTRLERETAAARAELAAARSTLEANRTVAEQPDWSILMAPARPADRRGRRPPLDLGRPVAGEPERAHPGRRPPARQETVLEVAGVGRTPLSVSRHVLQARGDGAVREGRAARAQPRALPEQQRDRRSACNARSATPPPRTGCRSGSSRRNSKSSSPSRSPRSRPSTPEGPPGEPATQPIPVAVRRDRGGRVPRPDGGGVRAGRAAAARTPRGARP